MKERLPACLVALLGAVLYRTTAFPWPDWLDAPELASASYRLGIFHPPGSPLAVVLGHLVWFFTAAMPAVFSALFAGAGLYVLARLVQDLWRSLGPDHRLAESAWVFLVAALFAVTPGVWSQALRLEVYTLGWFLAVCALRELCGLALMKLDPPGADRRADRFVFLTGMGLAVHPLMALGALAGGLGLLTHRAVRRACLPPRRLARLGLMGLLGAAPLFLIPLMVKLPGDFRWGDPASPFGWLAFVSASTFAPTFAADPGPASGEPLRALAVVASGLGLPVLLTALAGFYLLARRHWRLALALGLVIAAGLATLLLQRSVRLDNPDATGYTLVALAALFLAGCGFLAIAGRLLWKRTPRAAWLPVLLAAGGLGGYAIATGGGMDRSGCRSGPALAARSLSIQPEGTVLLLADFNLVFMFDYLCQVHGLRPDLRTVYLRDLDNPALRKALATSDPGLESRLPASSALDRASLVKLSERGPVALDPGPHLSPAGHFPLSPRGLTWLWQPRESVWANQHLAAQREFFRPVAPPVCADDRRDPRTADLVTWHAYWHAQTARALGLAGLAGWMHTVTACTSPMDRLAAGPSGPPPDCPASRSLAANLPPPGRPPWWRVLLLGIGLAGWLTPLIGGSPRARRTQAGLSLAGLFLLGWAVVVV